MKQYCNSEISATQGRSTLTASSASSAESLHRGSWRGKTACYDWARAHAGSHMRIIGPLDR
eukprot:3664130-Rhodomonas_salina.2